MDMSKNTREFYIGITIILINSIWILKNIYFLFMYNFTNRLWIFMIPNWILILNTLLALIGIFIGFKIKSSSLKLWKGLTINILLIFLGILIEFKVITGEFPYHI